MEVISLLMRQNVIMFIYMFIGIFLYKKKLLTTAGSGDIGKLLLYIIMPVAILKSYLQQFSMELLGALGISFLASLIALLLSILISKLAFGKKYPIEHFGAAFSNAGFIGIPLVQMTLGQDAVFYVASFVAILNILQWTYGVFVITDGQNRISIRTILTNPIVISFVAGLLLFFLPLQMPELVTSVLSTIAAMNGPLAMIVMGAYLGQLTLKELFLDPTVYICSLVRLIVIPLATILILSVLPKEYLVLKQTILIAAAAPVGANVAIFASLHHKNYTQAVKDVCLSTVLCIISYPLILAIANLLWM